MGVMVDGTMRVPDPERHTQSSLQPPARDLDCTRSTTFQCTSQLEKQNLGRRRGW